MGGWEQCLSAALTQHLLSALPRAGLRASAALLRSGCGVWVHKTGTTDPHVGVTPILPGCCCHCPAEGPLPAHPPAGFASPLLGHDPRAQPGLADCSSAGTFLLAASQRPTWSSPPLGSQPVAPGGEKSGSLGTRFM